LSKPGQLGLQAGGVSAIRLRLTLQAFQIIASQLIAARDPRQEILKAFRLFDADEKGIVTVDDLRRVASELNQEVEEDQLAYMIDCYDLDGKGGVGPEEFVEICMR
jgi:Ca2+-binding EF-hand superfamily protein